MFAVIKTGGKQYKVSQNNVITIEKIIGKPGSIIDFKEILMIGAENSPVIIGTPTVKGAVVKAEILNQARGEKVIVFKKQRRQHYRRKNGHRQSVTQLLIKEILKS